MLSYSSWPKSTLTKLHVPHCWPNCIFGQHTTGHPFWSFFETRVDQKCIYFQQFQSNLIDTLDYLKPVVSLLNWDQRWDLIAIIKRSLLIYLTMYIPFGVMGFLWIFWVVWVFYVIVVSIFIIVLHFLIMIICDMGWDVYKYRHPILILIHSDKNN